MSKDKKDKLKKYDLFSIMMDQSAVFRDMVAQFQSNFGFQTNVPSRVSDEVEHATTGPAKAKNTVKASAAMKGAKAKVSANATKPVAKAAVAKKTGAKKVAAKKVPAKKALAPAIKKSVAKSVPKNSSKKAFTRRK